MVTGLISKKNYDEAHIKLGYPLKEDYSRIIGFKWNGYKIKKINHPFFGNEKIKVYAINLSQNLCRGGMSYAIRK